IRPLPDVPVGRLEMSRMIRSMTAFAAAERSTEWGTLACEVRAVNHRFLELGVRLPAELRTIEPALRERVGAPVSRGKLDVGFRFRAAGAAQADISLNRPLVERLSSVAVSLSNAFPGLNTDFTDLLRFPGVLEEARIDQAGLQDEAMALLDGVLAE